MTRPDPVQQVLQLPPLLAQIAEALPDACCRRMRSVSFPWYRVLSNVIARRCLDKLPLYRQDAWLLSRADRHLEAQIRGRPQASKRQAIVNAVSRHLLGRTQASAEILPVRISRVQEYKQTQLATLFKVVQARREEHWNRLDVLKHRLPSVCRQMAIAGCIPASWDRATRYDPVSPLCSELPWYFHRLNPDLPSPVTLCLQMYEVCRTLYPTPGSIDYGKYGELEAHGISPMPGQLTLLFIEQLIDHSLNTTDPQGPWALSVPSAQMRLRESHRPTMQEKEPDWALVAHLAQADMTEELALYQRATNIDISTSLSAQRLTDMLRDPDRFLLCCELLRVCDVRVEEQAGLAKIYERALLQRDWQIMARILRDCDLILSKYVSYTNLNKREQLIRALVISPAPVEARQQRAMLQVFDTLRQHSLLGRSGQLSRSFHATCLKHLRRPVDPAQPVHATLRAWEALANQALTVIEKHWGTPAFPDEAKNVLKDIYNIPLQVPEPVLMTLLAATDDVSLYRQAVTIGLLTSSPNYSAAPHVGQPGMLTTFSQNISPLHAVLQHDALNLFKELVDPAYIFEGKKLLLDGQERPLSDCLARLNAHKIRQFVEAGGMPLMFSSRERAEAFKKSFAAARAKLTQSTSPTATSFIGTSSSSRSFGPNHHLVADVDAQPATEERITQLMESRHSQAIMQAVALCQRLAPPSEKHHAAAMVLRLWRHATNPELRTRDRETLSDAVRAAAFRMKVQFTQSDLNAFLALGVHQRRFDYIIGALRLPYESTTRVDLSDLLKKVLPLCGDSEWGAQGKYRALSKTLATSVLGNADIDVYACELLYPTGTIPSERSRSRHDPQSVLQSVAVELASLFYGSRETAAAHMDKMLEYADAWQSRSPKARFKRTEDIEKLREDVKGLLQRIAHLRLPVDDIHTLFRGMCIVNHSKLTYELLKILDLNEKTLDNINKQLHWNCFEMIIEHGADKVFRAVHLKNGYPDHWLSLSAKRIEHSLQQSGKRGIAVFDVALSALSHYQVLDLFMRWVRDCPESFTDINSGLHKLLRHCAHPDNPGLSEGDVESLAEYGQRLHGEKMYRAIMEAASE